MIIKCNIFLKLFTLSAHFIWKDLKYKYGFFIITVVIVVDLLLLYFLKRLKSQYK